ncbi:MAG: hypothetical protein J6T57_03335 [Alphaproteobacteria bacterium]|nr:hypothetical protein [Alphaproteobacteria bacterium]
MNSKYISYVGILLVSPAFAGARLPAVNMSAGAVSARAQYGATEQNVATRPQTISAKQLVPVSNNVSPRPTGAKKNIVSRGAKPAPKKAALNKDTGEKIAATPEYLIPNRPSSDLWARGDAALRMPHANEFSLITSNELLPEESISSIGKSNLNRGDEITNIAAKTSDLDAQIARLIDLQQQAESATRSSYFSHEDTATTTAQIAPHTNMEVPASVIRPADADDGVKLSRVVVPRDDLISNDVVVRAVKKDAPTRIEEVRNDMTKMSPSELRRAFRKTFLSENKHLSTYSIDDKFDVVSDMGSGFEGFTSARDLSEDAEKIRPLEIKIGFRNSDSALSRENYNLLSEYAGIVVSNPKRAIQIAIPASATTSTDARKLTARRLAIVEQVLRDTGVAEQRIVPVLSNRDEPGFVLRIISNEQYETLTRQKRNMFGDTVGSKTYKSMSW